MALFAVEESLAKAKVVELRSSLAQAEAALADVQRRRAAALQAPNDGPMIPQQPPVPAGPADAASNTGAACPAGDDDDENW